MPTSPLPAPTSLLNATQAGQWAPSLLRAYAANSSKERQYYTIIVGIGGAV